MPNVSVSNTPGLYIGSGASAVLNSAQQLYALLSNSGNVNFALINNNTAVQSYFIGNTGGGGGSYGNVDVAAFLPTYTGTLDNSSTIVSLVGNAATQAIAIGATNANLGAFQTYANSTFGTSSFGNANVAVYLPTYTGTLDNSVTIINLWSNAAGQATAINTINANLGAFQTFSNANAAGQATEINTLNANLGAFQTYANLNFGTSSYANANVAAYLPVFGGTIQVLNITGVPGQNITLSPDGTQDVYIDADTVRVGDNNSDFTLATHGTGNLTLTTHLGDANQGNITLVDGANGNIKLWPNGSGVVEAAGNVKASYYLGDGSQLINLPVQSGTYSNTNVAAYLPTYTGSLAQSSTIIDLYSNAATQATAINTINANLGAYQTFANANVSNLQDQITGANIAIQTTSANLGAYQIYANAAIDSSTYYTDANVAAFLPVFGGNILTGNVFVEDNLYVQGYTVSTYIFTANTSWTVPTGNTIISAKALLVGGGGAGGSANNSRFGGGGGAGGLLANVNITNSITPGGTYSIVVGAGGSAGGNVSTAQGKDSSAFGYTAKGGGYGGSAQISGMAAGNNGGSGGGGYGQGRGAALPQVYGGGSGTPGQGYSGDQGDPGGLGFGGGKSGGPYGNPGVSYFYYYDNITGANVGYAAGGSAPLDQGGSVVWKIQGGESTTGTLPTITNYGSGGAGAYTTSGSTSPGSAGYQGIVVVQLVQAGYTGGTLITNNRITTGNISANFISASDTVSANRYSSTTGYFWANGTSYSTGGGGGGGSDFTSNLTINGNYILNGNINLIREQFANIGTLNGVSTINANIGMIQAAVVASNITINTNNLTNFVPGQTITLKLTQATNTNLRILTSNILYAGGSKTLSTANAAIDTISITWDGEQYLGALVRGYS